MAEQVFYNYTDFDLSFKAHPATGDLVILRDEQAVSQSVKNLVLTMFNERFLQPTIGSGVYGYLFENATPSVLISLRHAIEHTITANEPRIGELKVVITDNIDENAFQADITFQIIALLRPLTMKILLSRTR